MKVLFTNTNYQRRVEYTSLISVVPPLELAYGAALVRERLPGVEVGIIDANVEDLTEKEHARRIREAGPDVLVFWAATYSINSVSRLTRSLRGDVSWMVLAGPHGTALPEDVMAEIPGIDVVIRGEIEHPVLELVKALESGGPLAGVKGIHFRENGVIRHTEDDTRAKDIDSLPFPARDLLPNHLYSSPYSSRVTALRTTRGCPGRCRFCDSHLLVGHRTRTRDPAAVADEIEECVGRYGTDYFAVIDHTFTARRSFVTAVCSEITRRGLNRRIRWACNTRVDMLSDEMLAVMRGAGCLQIGIGIESADNARLSAVGKGITEDQIRDAIRRIKRHGIIAMGYTIIGFPTDSAESIRRTRDRILEFDPHTLQLSFATPLPGTELRRECLEQDRILSDDWDDYVFLRRSIIRNDTLSTSELERLRRDIVKRFYFRPGKLVRLIAFLMFRARPSYVSALRAGLKVISNVNK
ncbi:MAG: radical SAM protein [Deltaproteobacteria bacterium]|nr:radical SAM protein [Deltaproteobacteria bacterium]